MAEKNVEELYAEMEAAAHKNEKKTRAESNVDQMLDGVEKAMDGRKKSNPELLRFFGGLLLFGAGLYMIFQNLIISSSWGMGYIFHIGGFGLPNGTIMIPLLIGIALLFLCDRKLWGWLFIAIGIVIVIAAVIMSVSIQWRTSNGWMFVVMFGMTFAGGAMMLRELFKK